MSGCTNCTNTETWHCILFVLPFRTRVFLLDKIFCVYVVEERYIDHSDYFDFNVSIIPVFTSVVYEQNLPLR